MGAVCTTMLYTVQQGKSVGLPSRGFPCSATHPPTSVLVLDAYSCAHSLWTPPPPRWKAWSGMIDNSPIPADAKFRQIIVPTVDTVRYGYLLDKTLRNGSPLLVVGPTGTGEGELQGGGMGALQGTV